MKESPHRTPSPALAPPLDREGALRYARRFRDAIAPLYGERLRAVYLFGSHARGEGNEDSDIDVAVVLEPPLDRKAEVRRTSELRAMVSLEAGQVLMPFFVASDAPFDKVPSVFDSIRREGIEL